MTRKRDPIAEFRRAMYGLGRASGDVQAVRHRRVGKRLVNKVIGRKIVSRLWWR